jgi:hypothetical protein
MLDAFVLEEKIKGFSRGMKEGIHLSQRNYIYVYTYTHNIQNSEREMRK